MFAAFDVMACSPVLVPPVSAWSAIITLGPEAEWTWLAKLPVAAMVVPDVGRVEREQQRLRAVAEAGLIDDA